MIKELKIRESLKAIFELYSEVEDFIFTTYNYEPDFFDEHIVAYLIGFDRKISTYGELKDADEWIREHNISVYYDCNAMSPGSSCLTVPVFPQRVNTGGVFHPKVIVIYGKLKERNKKPAHLFVSSCNLTVSGYGRNKEAFACVEVKSKQIAESLSEFIDSLVNDSDQRHLELQKYLASIKQSNNDIEFIWTNSDSGTVLGTVLLEYLKENSFGDLTVVSPYFDENGPASLLNELTKRDKTVIVPAVDGETYNIHKKDYAKLSENGVKFSSLFNDDDSRFIHAKLIKYGSQLIIGSYNFTSAAMRGKNAEAALVFNNAEDYKFRLIKFSEERLLPDEEKISNRDESDSSVVIPFVILTVFWKELKIQITAENIEPQNSYSLRLDGATDDFISSLQNFDEKEISTELANHLLTYKSFSVYCDGKICFKGLINEIDARDYRPELSCESLNESIREWYLYSDDGNKDDKRSLRLINPEDEETDRILGITQEDTADIFDNYYLVSKAFENLLNQIQLSRSDSLENAPVQQRKTEKYLNSYYEWEQKKNKADKNLFGFLSTKPGSIENIVAFLQKDHAEKKNKDIIYEWLVVNYMKMVIKIFPENDVNKIYKEKLDIVAESLIKISEDIDTVIKGKVDRKYLNWILDEFNKRNNNV